MATVPPTRRPSRHGQAGGRPGRAALSDPARDLRRFDRRVVGVLVVSLATATLFL